MGFFWILVTGAIAGMIAGKYMKESQYGLPADIVLGVVGASTAALLVRLLGPSGGVGVVWSVIVAIVGSTLLLVAARRFMKLEPVPTRRPRRR